MPFTHRLGCCSSAASHIPGTSARRCSSSIRTFGRAGHIVLFASLAAAASPNRAAKRRVAACVLVSAAYPITSGTRMQNVPRTPALVCGKSQACGTRNLCRTGPHDNGVMPGLQVRKIMDRGAPAQPNCMLLAARGRRVTDPPILFRPRVLLVAMRYGAAGKIRDLLKRAVEFVAAPLRPGDPMSDTRG